VTAFKVAAEPAKVSLLPGESAKARLTVSRLKTFDGPVTLRLNPMTTMVESYRAVLMGTEFPSARRLVAVAVGSALLAFVGWLAFRRAEPRFVDEL